MPKVILFVFCLLTVCPGKAAAEILSPDELHKLFNAPGQEIRAFSAVMEFSGSALKLAVWQKENRWRQEWIEVSGGSEEVTAASVGRGILALNSLGISEAGPPVLSLLFKDMKWWLDQGLNPGLQSYQFFHKRPALAVGVKFPDETGPAAWFDNENRALLRAVLPSGQDSIDVGWLEYMNVGNHKLPSRVIISSGQGDFSAQVTWREINSGLDDSLFSPDELEKSFGGYPYQPSEFVHSFNLVQKNIVFARP